MGYGTGLHGALLLFLAAGGASGALAADEVIPLYQGRAPGTEGWTQKEATIPLKNPQYTPPAPDTLVVNVVTPTLTVFRPAAGKANGTAIIVAPGGGFRVLSYGNEGLDVAHWLTAHGITAFVLKYRLHEMPADADQILKGASDIAKRIAPSAPAAPPAIEMGPIENGAIADGQQAIKLVRARAAEFGIDPNKIGIIGFSAGGAVAGGATVKAAPADRPNFTGIIYSFTPGDIPKGAPPAFMAAAADDPLSAAMPDLFTRWRASGAPAEIHIYAKGKHGFGMIHQGLPVDHWIEAFYAWLAQQGFVPAAAS